MSDFTLGAARRDSLADFGFWAPEDSSVAVLPPPDGEDAVVELDAAVALPGISAMVSQVSERVDQIDARLSTFEDQGIQTVSASPAALNSIFSLTAVNEAKQMARKRVATKISVAKTPTRSEHSGIVTEKPDLSTSSSPVRFGATQPKSIPGGVKAGPLLRTALDECCQFTSNAMKCTLTRYVTHSLSVAVFKDAFWFIHDRVFKKYPAGMPEAEIAEVEEASAEYMRMSDNFVRLFVVIKPAHTDDFFNRYFRVLSSALVAAFLEAIPSKKHQFDDAFRRSIEALTAQWTTGALLIQKDEVQPAKTSDSNGEHTKKSRVHGKHTEAKKATATSTLEGALVESLFIENTTKPTVEQPKHRNRRTFQQDAPRVKPNAPVDIPHLRLPTVGSIPQRRPLDHISYFPLSKNSQLVDHFLSARGPAEWRPSAHFLTCHVPSVAEDPEAIPDLPTTRRGRKLSVLTNADNSDSEGEAAVGDGKRKGSQTERGTAATRTIAPALAEHLVRIDERQEEMIKFLEDRKTTVASLHTRQQLQQAKYKRTAQQSEAKIKNARQGLLIDKKKLDMQREAVFRAKEVHQLSNFIVSRRAIGNT